eukprot:gene57273-78479_t
MPVTFSYADRDLKLQHKTRLKAFIAILFQQEGKELGQLSYVFCSDDFLLDINQRFLRHDYYTDIITFDFTEAGDDKISGEVYVSIDRIRDNALANKVTFATEVVRVVFHGALHLCGFLDKKKSEIVAMREREDHYLRLISVIGFSQGTYTYKPGEFNIVLPQDTGVMRMIRATPVYSTLSDFENDMLYAINYVRLNPSKFKQE